MASPDHEGGGTLTAGARIGGPRAGTAGGGPWGARDWRHSSRVDLVQSLRSLIAESNMSRVNAPCCGGLRSLDRLCLERPRERGREEEDEEVYSRLRRLPRSPSLSERLWLRRLDLRPLLDLLEDESDAEGLPVGETLRGGAPCPLGPGRRASGRRSLGGGGGGTASAAKWALHLSSGHSLQVLHGVSRLHRRHTRHVAWLSPPRRAKEEPHAAHARVVSGPCIS